MDGSPSMPFRDDLSTTTAEAFRVSRICLLHIHIRSHSSFFSLESFTASSFAWISDLVSICVLPTTSRWKGLCNRSKIRRRGLRVCILSRTWEINSDRWSSLIH